MKKIIFSIIFCLIVGNFSNTYASEKINKELVDLEMKNAKINVKVDYKANEFFEDGKDQV